MSFTVSELRFLRWLVIVAQQAVPSNHLAAEHIPTMLTRIDLTSGCSPERTKQAPELRQLNRERITTREAALRLGITQRAIQQRILRGHLKADRVGRTYLINPEHLA